MFERSRTATGGTSIRCYYWLDGLFSMVSGPSSALLLGIGFKGIIFSDESLKPR
jgi:hypothetical protein